MTKRTAYRFIGIIGIVIVFVTACAETPTFIQRALGRDIAEQRRILGEDWCPQITAFAVSPLTAKCGEPVSLDIAAQAFHPERVSYAWEIEGQTFETGQKAIWNTPTSRTIGEPERAYTVRGIANDGECAVTRSAEVKVLCSGAFDLMVHFAFAKANLDATAKTILDEFGKKLQEYPEYTILIEGHTDYIGGNQTNLRLGQKRADAVKNYLVKTWHVDPYRIITRSCGEEQPLAPNDLDSGRAQNRRAELFRVLLTTK